MQRFSGFVVLELMQVIGIIGILAAAYLAPDCRSWQTSPKSNH